MPPPDNLNNQIDPHCTYEERSLTLPIADFTARSTPGGGEMSDLSDHITGDHQLRTGVEDIIATSLLPGHPLNSACLDDNTGTGLASECACACAFVHEDVRERRRPPHACACSICVRLRHSVRLQSVAKLNRPPSAFCYRCEKFIR
ncbi:unnamed protein product [Colias eurytheme]|nr:unnamed protein product [Colias eurytheme]